MMKTICLTIVAACTLFVARVPGAESLKTFTGVVTDTMCGSKPHSNMMKDKTEAECVRLCARGPNGYALFDGTAVMKLSDQKTSAKYAGQQVKVTGVYDEKSKTLKVASIEPANGN
ncbi:MAG: hypothetical protein ABSG41_10625 [Bryobacteraceae bacterium]|jgi:hypothetical protein